MEYYKSYKHLKNYKKIIRTPAFDYFSSLSAGVSANFEAQQAKIPFQWQINYDDDDDDELYSCLDVFTV